VQGAKLEKGQAVAAMEAQRAQLTALQRGQVRPPFSAFLCSLGGNRREGR
jgi:hypothetical protein